MKLIIFQQAGIFHVNYSLVSPKLLILYMCTLSYKHKMQILVSNPFTILMMLPCHSASSLERLSMSLDFGLVVFFRTDVRFLAYISEPLPLFKRHLILLKCYFMICFTVLYMIHEVLNWFFTYSFINNVKFSTIHCVSTYPIN